MVPPRDLRHSFNQDFSCPDLLFVCLHFKYFVYRALTFFGQLFQVIQLHSPLLSYRLFPFRSPLLRRSRLISFPLGTEMFQFPRFASHTYVFSMWYQFPSGFPHSDIFGSSLVANSPKLFAGCHVFLRLLLPRHSPCALTSLDHITPSPLHLSQVINSSPLFQVLDSIPPD